MSANYRTVVAFLSFVVLAATSIPRARALDIAGDVAIGQKSLELRIRDRSFEPTFTTLTLAMTGAGDGYYVTLDHEFSVKDPIETASDGLIFYSRQDTNLTVGFSALDWLNIFGGYRQGETQAHYSAVNDEFGNTSDGPYLGLSSSHSFEDVKGNFGISLAVADLDGEVSLAEPFVDTSVFLVGESPPSHVRGSALGFSLGLNWNGAITADTLFNVTAKLQRYKFEDEVVFGGLDLTYEENTNTVSIGLVHFF